MKRTLIDLFAGIGGFSYAAHQLGWETLLFCEKDKFCQKVLKKNFGDVSLIEDVFDVSAKSIRQLGITERPFAVSLGFPCQPFSHAGKREGTKDERHLFPQGLRIISELKPRWVVAENVRGLLSIESGQVFADVISSLEGEGYEVVTFCIPASAVGAPHRRDRLWIVARRLGVIGNADSGWVFNNTISGISERSESVAERCDSTVERFTSNAFSTQNDRIGRYSQRGRFGMGRETETALENDGQADSNGIVGCGGFASDTAEQGLQIGGYEGFGQFQKETGEKIHDRFELNDSESFTDHWKRVEEIGRGDTTRRRIGGEEEISGDVGQLSWRTSWLEAATALCRVDDGVSRQLDRTNRLKALGNSIVPQIAFEIFKAIEQAES